MKSERLTLVVDVVRLRLTKLNDVLSKGDYERLEKILPLFGNDENPRASVADCLDRLSPELDTQAQLADFRTLRFRLKEAAAKVGMGLELTVDSKKRSAPSERRCWFTLPHDPTSDRIGGWTEQEIAGDVSSPAISQRAWAVGDWREGGGASNTDTPDIERELAPFEDEKDRGARALLEADSPLDERRLIKSKAQETALDPAAAFLQEGRRLVVAVDELQAWVEDESGAPYCVVLGEYGIGKTTTLKQFAQSLLAQRREGRDAPLPIFVDLRNFSSTIHRGDIPTLEVLLQELLEQVWKPFEKLAFTAQDILRLVREEGAVLIFDGLDEKLVHLDEAQGRAFLRTLWHALPPSAFRAGHRAEQVGLLGRPGRLVFSCRSHYFKTLRDQNAMLRGEDRDGLRATHYFALFLLPFDAEQIRGYLAQVMGSDHPEALPEGNDRVDAALRLFESVHNLSELAPRPYLLSLMSDYLGELEARRASGEIIQGVTLYEMLVNEWLMRDGGKHSLRPEDKLRLMEDIAADMWRAGAREWEWNHVLDWLSQRLGQRAVWRTRYLLRGSQELLEEDFRTATFVLRPDDQDRFRFAHTSFQEYFLARYLHRVLAEGEENCWDLDNPSPEILNFLGQLIVTAPGTRDKVLGSMEAILERGPTPATGIAFRYWLQAVKHGFPQPAPQQVQLQSVNLSDLEIRGRSQAQPLNLIEVDLSGANLRRSLFADVNFSDGNLSGVQAEGATFHRVTAFGLNLAGADLTAAIWRHSDIRGLKGGATATWYDCQLLACDIEPSDLPENFAHAGTLSDPRNPARSLPPVQVVGDSQVTTTLVHASIVESCAVAPDGNFIVSGSRDKTLKLWDIRTGSCLRTFEGHADIVYACEVTPDSNSVISASGDGIVKLWDIRTGNCLRTFRGSAYVVYACAVTSDGKGVIIVSDDGTLKLWNIHTGTCLRTFKGPEEIVRACVVTPDGNGVVSASGDGTLRLWDIHTGRCLSIFEGHADMVYGCAVTPDGNSVVLGSYDGTLKLWDVGAGSCLRAFEEIGRSPAFVCALTPDSSGIVSGLLDGTLQLWDVRTGSCLRTFEGHGFFVRTCAVTPDGKGVVSGSWDKTLKLWDIGTGSCLRTFEGTPNLPIYASAATPDGSGIVSGSLDGTLQLWDVRTGSSLRTFKAGDEDIALACAVTPDGKCVVSGSADSSMRLWDIATGACLRTFEGHADMVDACAVTPDGNGVVSGSADGGLKLWDIGTGACLRVFEGHAELVHACAVTLNGDRVVSASGDSTLKLWDIATGGCLRTFEGHAAGVRTCAVTPDGKCVISGSEDGSMRLWDIATGACLRTFEGHAAGVQTCAVVPDGKCVVSGSADGSMRLWDIATGACLRTFEGHAAGVLTCAVTPDGKCVISGSEDGSMKLWKLDSSNCHMTVLNGPYGQAAAVDHLNNRILSATPDAWHFVGWRFFDPDANRLRILPAEHAGPLPGQASAPR